MTTEPLLTSQLKSQLTMKYTHNSVSTLLSNERASKLSPRLRHKTGTSSPKQIIIFQKGNRSIEQQLKAYLFILSDKRLIILYYKLLRMGKFPAKRISSFGEINQNAEVRIVNCIL